ncbi:UDP-N-acetylmuramoyl-tripeptide--D-alanyl-D-alanine ligase [Melghirimyces profundicolus]|uniref:UDP-N-acetylmuramoyl-tripeptide--D-alanyl-D-alanine ligase n=1 Tax=Melghirimyces profundicolus TaxID=1242148 RepID=A0A2T6B582_9BACL|nr:UDP-N-acetylmuramoyl-tripeptide--D-alanyl-D-alanine ligase [Melghirimyces profundicolus]PTX51239.1 UDP-N-acetylmuramoyl-tripeptide--D-alanyl-D-alanine ligase [Melghirimyces profundicolus]
MQKTLREIKDAVNGKLIGGVSDGTLLVDGVSTDTRTLKENQLYIPLKGERFDGHDFLDAAAEKGAAAALWSKDLPEHPPIPLLQVENTLTALQELAAACRRESGVKVVGITGSNGKTTTKDLTGAVLGVRYRVHRTRGNLNNHIGLPLTILSMPENTEVAVLEMGMNRAGEIARLSEIAAPDVAVVTNIGEAHLEFLGSREAIADAKLEILKGLSDDGVLLIDGDEPLLRRRLAGEERNVVGVGFESANEDTAYELELKGTEGIAFRSSSTGNRFRLGMMGRHNAVNALLAINVGRLFNLTEQEIQKGLDRVERSGMRLDTLTAANGMTVVDDSYNASPTAIRATIDLMVSLEGFREKWVLLGDILELGEEEETLHREVGRYAAEHGVTRLFTLGERARWIADGARAADPNLPVTHFHSAEEAAEKLLQDGGEEVALLVKASRGARLERVVQQLTKGENSA